MRRAILALCAAAAAFAIAVSAGAEFYSWTDAEGRTHFTQDLSQVPAEQRHDAIERTRTPPRATSLQKFAPPPAKRSQPAAGGTSATTGRVHRIEVQRAGTSMMVQVRLNNSVTAPFIIDTGASDVLVPKAVADQLGLDTGPEGRRKVYSTANGRVEQAVVMLDSVRLGTAEARQVPASVSPHMRIGLLGLSFFNRFSYNIDAAAGVVTLRPNGLEQTGGIRGGRSEAQWRAEYRNLHGRVAAVNLEKDRTPSHHSREVRRLEGVLEDLERQLELLDGEADHARVPFTWRR